MPHVEIKCFPGRSEELKAQCAAKVAEDVAATLGCPLTSVSVAIKEVESSAWKSDVWDKQIVVDEKYLYKKPEYTP
ncbi:MAG: tautomerase family protein [Lachnospiraceae bacterium]|nr:tautomerase family protein [Lachnospiraceae bacterium]